MGEYSGWWQFLLLFFFFYWISMAEDRVMKKMALVTDKLDKIIIILERQEMKREVERL